MQIYARSWRFYMGYVKKCGDAAQMAIRKATKGAQLKPGTVGIRVSIMPPNVRLPDDIRPREVSSETLVVTEKVEAVPAVEAAVESKETTEEKPKKRSPRKKKAKAEEAAAEPIGEAQ